MSHKDDYIIISGAKVHNLKNISLEIPRDKLLLLQAFREVENHR